MISYVNVTKRFGDTLAVDNVTIVFEPGKIHALLGPNGSGKSTLMKMALGVVTPDEGEVRVCNINPSLNPVEAKKIIGFVPEENIVYESLTPAELLSFIGSIRGLSSLELKERVDTFVKLFRLEEHMGKLCGELSHGNKRKVLIAAALLHDPKVIILDEPFTGLDPGSGKVLKEILKKSVKEGKTIVFSTHILELAEAVAEEVTIMHSGRVVARGNPEELRSELKAADLESVFLEKTGLSAEIKELLKVLWGE